MPCNRQTFESLHLSLKRLADPRRAKLHRRIHCKYLRSVRYINNWDLVDVSAEHIIGGFLADKDKRILLRLARSANLWERCIAVLATFHFIRRGRFTEVLKIATALLCDEHDLIHKAVGWMLREVGRRDRPRLERFLSRRLCTELTAGAVLS